ncbi:serine-rich adhesin for platelets-like [Topomyia yanbarensis]|uniref:serine-rich adhesin for platelets-like n=1 Tax=Topomyia yanbarensis TaxID=2498891 RepID=UPI00273CB353|nr:serine-rich adhesin for platelets-like [Topomyia yanbarensis]XP_058837302.1 serine-rich adhesin for platelets-like [Topomyia yanbarensis]XP_058837303.1 serine-rich adhesin for platelets-like [Topomyia yanbarensis]
MSKTIETHLQSNEVRIPKKTGFDVSSSAAPCQYFKSSFARSLSFSQGGGGGGGPYGTAEQHFTRSLDFEVNFGLSTIPDQPPDMGSSQTTTPSASPVYDPERDLVREDGKTKLANGIATSNGGVVKTLWSYAKISDTKPSSSGGAPHKAAVPGGGAVPATSTSSPSKMPSGSGSSSSTRKSVEANEIEVLRLRKECQNLIEENRRLVNLAANSGYATNGVMNGASGAGIGRSSLGSERSSSTSSGSSSLTTLGLGLAGGGVGVAGSGTGTAAGMYSSVESVILQTQVETLQWQLKQVDSSRQMYRAVMEEVVRYLDRCYRGLDALQPNIIGRSKSVLQVSKNHSHHDSDSSSASSPRARSSTNLIDVQKTYTKKQLELLSHQQQQQQQQLQNSSIVGSPLQDDDCIPPSPAGSYSTFRDFTWRRSPKRIQTLSISSAEVDPEKLAQEAFRLLRTVQNLLNTQEPTLSQSSTGLDSMLLASAAGSTTGSTTTLTGTGGGLASSSAPTVHHHHHHHHVPTTVDGLYGGVVNTRSNVGFSRKLNMRGSRLSLRSSTDDSVHSTSSSNKAETDEDNTDRPSPPLSHHLHHHHHPLVHQHQNSGSSSSSSSSSNSSHLINHRHSANIDRIKEMMISCSAEDESGFSSMNSFQEIGLPLINSTVLSSSTASSTTGVGSADSNSSTGSSTGSVSFVSDDSSDMRDNTMVPTSNVTTIAINPITNGPSVDSSGSSKHLSDKLGIPSPSKAPEIPARVTQSAAYEHHSHFINHRRWDSAPVVPPKLKIHQHNGDSDSGVSSRVLWV